MDILVSFIALLAISVFLTVRFKVNSAAAPFIAVAGITLLLCYTCTVNLLVPAVLLVYAAALAALVYVFWLKRADLKENLKAIVTPGFVFFVGISVFFWVTLSQKNPYFAVWDEFSFWGTAAKAVFENDRIYTLVPSSMINTSYPPGLPLWSYFMQFLGSVFAEWKVYLAYDVMAMAALSALFAKVRWKNPITIAVVGLFAFFGIYSFWWSGHGLVFYCTSYSDFQLGFVFAGTLLSWYHSEEKSFPHYIGAVLTLMLLPMVKDMGLAFGMIGAGIITMDMIFADNYPSRKVLKKDHWALRLVYPLLLFAAVAMSYLIWTGHFNAVKDIPRVEIPYPYSIVDMLMGRDAYFLGVLQLMWKSLGETQLLTFGTIGEMLAVFTLAPILLGAFTGSWRKFLRLCSFSAVSLAGYAAYSLFMAYAYTAIFKRFDVVQLVTYERYMSSYAIAWFFAMVGVCLFEIASPRFKKLELVGGTVIAALLLAVHFHFCPVPTKHYIYTSKAIDLAPTGVRQLIIKQASRFQGALTYDDRIYFVCQESDGGEWFLANYEFMPAYMVNTLGGGNLVSVDTPDSEMGFYDARAGQAELTAYIREQEIDYLFVFKINDYFYNEFIDMFDDKLTGFYDGSTHIYRVVDKGDNMFFVPVANSIQLEQVNAQFGLS